MCYILMQKHHQVTITWTKKGSTSLQKPIKRRQLKWPSKPNYVLTNLSELRTRSEDEWLRTAPGVSGPLWVCLGFTVLALVNTTSLSEVDAITSMLDPFFLKPTVSWQPASTISHSRFFPFPFKQSDCDKSTFLGPPVSAWDTSLFKFNFPKLDSQ